MLHFEMVPRAWNSLADWKNDMDRFLDHVDTAAGAVAPACEVVDAEKAFLIALDIPGYRKEDINLEVRDRRLHVAGERRAEERSETDKVLRQERRFGRFHRVFTLPPGIDEEGVEANFTDGVLRVKLPKVAVSTRKINVN